MNCGAYFQFQKTPPASQSCCCCEVASFIFVSSQICEEAETACCAVPTKILKDKCTW